MFSSHSQTSLQNSKQKPNAVPATEMFQEMKKIIGVQQPPAKTTVNSSVQTTIAEIHPLPLVTQDSLGLEQSNSEKRPDRTEIRKLLKLVHYLMVLNRNTPLKSNTNVTLTNSVSSSNSTNEAIPDGVLYEAILDSFEVINELADEAAHPEYRAHYETSMQVLDSYTQLILSLIRRQTLNRNQKHTIASLVYTSLTKLSTDSKVKPKRSDSGLVLMSAAVLAGVSQANVIEAMLNVLLGVVSASKSGKQAFIDNDVCGVIVPLLSLSNQTKANCLTSEILLTVVGDDESSSATQTLLRQCARTEALDIFATQLEQKQSMATIENLLVVLQKVSKRLEYRDRLRGNGRLCAAIQKLVDSGAAASSDFVMVNVWSIQQNLAEIV